MSKSSKKERELNYVPVNDTIGVPEKGWIKSFDFGLDDLDALVKRAKNRNQDIHSFLVNAGLRHVEGTPTIIFSDDVEETSDTNTDLTPTNTWKVADIKEWLEGKGVEVPAGTNKEGLLELVKTVDA